MGRTRGRKAVNFIAADARIGRGVKVWHYSYVGSKSVIGDNVSIGSLAHIDYGVKIGENTRIEGSVYIPPLSRIGKGSVVAMGAVVTKDVPPGKVVLGVPARVVYDRKKYDARKASWEAGRPL